MDELLKLLRDNAALRPRQLAELLDTSEAEVADRISAYEKNEIILGYRTVLNEEKLNVEMVRAVIEVKITPEREGGFDRVALRISRFEEVQSCYLMSGGYDLLVVVEGSDLRSVATFVSEKLATMTGVISTATHFILKPYKEFGVMMASEYSDEKLAVAP
jgi:DNA-binding Lrp family transcriptional regulator